MCGENTRNLLSANFQYAFVYFFPTKLLNWLKKLLYHVFSVLNIFQWLFIIIWALTQAPCYDSEDSLFSSPWLSPLDLLTLHSPAHYYLARGSSLHPLTVTYLLLLQDLYTRCLFFLQCPLPRTLCDCLLNIHISKEISPSLKRLSAFSTIYGSQNGTRTLLSTTHYCCLTVVITM